MGRCGSMGIGFWFWKMHRFWRLLHNNVNTLNTSELLIIVHLKRVEMVKFHVHVSTIVENYHHVPLYRKCVEHIMRI